MSQPAPSKTAELFGELQLRDYLQVVQRRRWWIILTATALTVITTIVVLRLPDIYKSETVILVDPQKVPDNYVAPTVNTSIADRLSTIQQEVMSPTRLKKLIETLHLFPEARGKANEQELVQRMQKAISVQVLNEGGRQLSSFRISYRGNNPVEVAQVANQLASMFIEQNLRSREQQSLGTTEFLEHELAKTKQELAEKEGLLRDVKSRNIMDLPDSKQFHIQALDSLRSQLQSSEDRVSRAQQEKMYLQAMMASSAPTVDLDAGGASSPYELQIHKLEGQLSELRARYGPNHPDVRKLQRQLDALRAQASKDQEGAPPPAPVQRAVARNPVVVGQLQKLDDEFREQQKVQAELRKQIEFHMSKLEQVPVFEQQLAGLMRDYDTLRQHYTTLLDKKLSAEMASNLESRQKGERFVILDPAQIPEKPFAPNRPLLCLVGLAAGLLGGLGLAIVVDGHDESVRSDREASRILGKPILGGVPQILTDQQVSRKRIRAIAAVVGTVASSVVVGFLVSFFSGKLF